MSGHVLTTEIASRFARLALAHVEREYPNKLDHVLEGPQDIRGPRALHPMFFGSFDWHSCVHGYWMLATLLRTYPRNAESTEIRALFGRRITEQNVAAEVAYLAEPMRGGFERPYGWAWVLMLVAELTRHETDDARRWSALLEPLARAFVARFARFLPKATYPTRVGTHFNSAFAIALALEYADVVRDKRFGRLLRGRAVAWYQHDADCQAWEPGGDDFLSSALIEVECMRRSLDAARFALWFERFLPHIGERQPATLFTPATVSNRTDGKIAHLDGLNLSRAWCWRSIATTMTVGDARRPVALDAATRHLDVAMPHVSGDYMGEHWLASFALLALLG